MNEFPFLDLTIFLPLAGALLIGLVPKRHTKAIRLAALAVTGVTFVVSLAVLAGFDQSRPGFQLGTSAPWIEEWVFHAPITADQNRRLTDLDLRELAMLAPIMALIVFIGVYPKPFLDRIEPAANRIVEQLNDGSVVPDAGVAKAP